MLIIPEDTGFRLALASAFYIKSLVITCAVSPFCPSGIPLVCFVVLLPLNIPWSQISVTWLGVVHFLACLSPQLGSVLYHLFMNHEGGEPVYHTLLKLDVCGICMINTLGECPPRKLSRFLYCLSSLSHCQLRFLLFALWVEYCSIDCEWFTRAVLLICLEVYQNWFIRTHLTA